MMRGWPAGHLPEICVPAAVLLFVAAALAMGDSPWWFGFVAYPGGGLSLGLAVSYVWHLREGVRCHCGLGGA